MYAITPSAIGAIVLSSLGRAEVWVAIVLVAVPTALVCGTVIVLVLAVERKDRVHAIRALPPLVQALVRQVGRLAGWARPAGRRRAPDQD